MSLRKLTIQPFIFVILISILQNLAFAAFGSSLSGSNNSPSLTNYASNDGVVPILKDFNGFYVNVDIGRPSTPSNQTQNTTAKMMLILMSNETTLASSCLSFSSYNCNSYPCSMIQIFNDFYEPWWHANNQLAKAFVSLDPSYWTLNNYAYLAYQCTGNNYNIGTGRYGAIGLGYAKANFLKDVLFSIWIDQNLESGTLLFGSDTAKYASSSSEIASFSASQYWNIYSLSGSIVIGTKSNSWNGVVGFDINSDVPGFDTSTFNSIINYIKAYSLGSQVTCSSSAYQPVCNYTGSFDFPDVKIMMRNNAGIPIPSDLIYINKTDSSFTLNMKILSDTLNNANYITPAYVGTVVLNAQIMSRFYIVFNGINETIHLYNANKSPGTSWEWLYILIFTLLGLILIGVLAYFAAKAIMTSDEDTEKPVYINYMQRSPLLNTENSMNQEDHQVFSGSKNKKNVEQN